jgi:hypothetical protein
LCSFLIPLPRDVRPIDRPNGGGRSNGKTVSESEHLILVTIRTVLVSKNSKLNFYDRNMMNITKNILSVSKFDPRIQSEKEKLYVSVSTVSVRIRSVFIPTFFSFTLVGGLLPVAAYFYPFVDGSFELCNNWLCTSSDVEAGFNYPISKKMYTTCTTSKVFSIIQLNLAVKFIYVLILFNINIA